MLSLANLGLEITLLSAVVSVVYLILRRAELTRRHVVFEITLVGFFVLGGIVNRVATFESDLQAATFHNQLTSAQSTLRTQQLHIRAQDKRVTIDEVQERADKAALRSAEGQAIAANHEIQHLQQLTADLGTEVLSAEKEAVAAKARADVTVRRVNILARQTDSRLRIAEYNATKAAAKAGVFRIPSQALAAIGHSIKQSSGVVNIACSPNFESACDDLSTVFLQAGWRVSVTKGASFLSGPDAGDAHGIYVFYGAGREELAIAIVRALQTSGVDAGARTGAPTSDISISLIYASRP